MRGGGVFPNFMWNFGGHCFLAMKFTFLFLNLAKIHIFIGPRSDHSLPMSLTHSLTHDLLELMYESWPKYEDYANFADYADYLNYAEYAEYADYAEYAGYVEYSEYVEYAEYAE